MIRTFLTLAGFAAAATVTHPTSAQGATFNGSEVVDAIKTGDLVQVVEQAGGEVLSREDDKYYVRAKTSDGLIYLLQGQACDVGGMPGCRGILMQVRYNSDEGVTPQTLMAASAHYSAVTMWWDNETVGFSRYVILDDGVTRKNIVSNLTVMLDLVPAVANIAFGIKE